MFVFTDRLTSRWTGLLHCVYLHWPRSQIFAISSNWSLPVCKYGGEGLGSVCTGVGFGSGTETRWCLTNKPCFFQYTRNWSTQNLWTSCVYPTSWEISQPCRHSLSMLQVIKNWGRARPGNEAALPLPSLTLVSFPGSPECKMYTRGKPGIFSLFPDTWRNQNRTRVFRTERQRFVCYSTNFAFNTWCMIFAPQ